MRRAAYALLLRARTDRDEFALDSHRGAQRAEPGAARESQALDLFQLLGRRIAPDLNIDRHLAERRRGCLGDLLQLRKAIADFGHGRILKRERKRPSLSLALARLHRSASERYFASTKPT